MASNKKPRHNLARMHFLSIIKTPITLIAWFLISLTFTLACIPIAFLPEQKRYESHLYFFLTTTWTKLMMAFCFLFVKKNGLENLPEYGGNPAIIVANHTSCIDIFLIESIIKNYPHIWITKDTYAKIPLFSILVNRMHVPINKTKPLQAAKVFLKTYKLAKNKKSHVIIFPEGTRYEDGKVHEFNHGFALLAKKLNRPVIPIAISGLHKIFPKKYFFIRYKAAQPTVTVGKPVKIKESESVEEFANRVRNWIINNKATRLWAR
jgi:1-acyl-sn-glycerol-3-phosphate acyltransferase